MNSISVLLTSHLLDIDSKYSCAFDPIIRYPPLTLFIMMHENMKSLYLFTRIHNEFCSSPPDDTPIELTPVAGNLPSDQIYICFNLKANKIIFIENIYLQSGCSTMEVERSILVPIIHWHEVWKSLMTHAKAANIR